MSRIIDRYILREIGESWLAVSAVLLLILIGNSFLFIFRQVGSGEIPADAVLPFLVTNTITFMVAIIPFSLYLGILIGMGRLYRDSEMAALAACGVGGWGLLRPALLLSAPAVAIVAVLMFYATPWAAKVERLARTEIASRSELSGVSAGQFNESRDGSTVLFVARIEKGDMSDVFVHGPDPKGGIGLEQARSASQETYLGQRYVVLEDGVRYIGTPGFADYTVIEFARHGVHLPSPPGREARLRRAGKSLQQLLASDNVKDLAELQWRIALMVAVLVLTLIAVPLSATAPREGRYARLALAVMVYLSYWNLLIIAKGWLRDGILPPVLGLWWVHLPVLALAGGIALHRAGRLRLPRLAA